MPFLVKRVYYENCPGCKNDEKKDCNLGLAYKELFYVWICVLATALTISSLFPYLYFMIRDLHIAERVEDIGFYAGFVGAAFMCGRAFTSFCWGVVADKWGRKPVIIIGLLSVVIFNTLFGLSMNYWMAISTRFLLGALNGLIGPIKAYAAEVTRPEHQSVGLSMVSTAWGIGLIIGPAIGGFLAQPAEKFPSVFNEASLFGRFPYLLPSLCVSLFAVVVLITCIWLPETLHNHPVNILSERKIVGKGDEEAGLIHSQENLLKNWPLMSSVIVYCVFAFHDMAYTEVFSLWSESDKKFGGLSFSTEDVGEVLAVTGFSLLVFQLLFYARAERLLGPINLTRVSAALAIPLLATYPPMTNLSGLTLKLVVNFASLVKNILSMVIVTGTFILQNNAVRQHQRGAANGITTTGESIFRGAAPAVAGIIFSWAQKRQNTSFLPGYEMVFFLLGAVEFIGLLMTFKPFLAVKA